LYREIRVDNELVDEDGEKAALKPGAEVDVIVEADSDATLKKPPTSEKKRHRKTVATQRASSFGAFEATSTAESIPLFSRRA